MPWGSWKRQWNSTAPSSGRVTVTDASPSTSTSAVPWSLTVPSSETGGSPPAVPLADPDSDPDADPEAEPDSRTSAPSSSPHDASTNTATAAGAARQLNFRIVVVYHRRSGSDLFSGPGTSTLRSANMC